jgi:hypothetical protein
MAEREGFEPSRGLSPLLAFQASAFNRSTTSPQSAPIIAVLGGLLLVGAATEASRQSVTGHYRVPQIFVRSSPPDPSGNAIANPGFETGSINDGWFQCGDVAAYSTTEHPYAGMYAAYLGTKSGAGEPLGNSGICQRVRIPPGGVLTAHLYQLSNEGGTSFAYQEADLLDDRGGAVVNLYKSVNDKPAWVLGRWNLAAYAGRTFWLYFGVHGDGYPKLSTQQFVDDVVVTASASPGPK